jgi:hypothetical protein
MIAINLLHFSLKVARIVENSSLIYTSILLVINERISIDLEAIMLSDIDFFEEIINISTLRLKSDSIRTCVLSMEDCTNAVIKTSYVQV